MATETSKSSALTYILGTAVVALGAVAIYLSVNNPGLPSAERNTLAQAQGPMPPPARLPTLPQSGDQMAPATAPTPEQPAQQALTQEPPAQELVPQQQQEAPAQPRVTRLAPTAPSQERPAASQPQGSCDDPEYAAKFC